MKTDAPWFIHGVAFDISDLKRVEEELQEERNFVSAILDQLQVSTSGHAHGSAARNLRSIIEEAIYGFAPDLVSLTILGLEDELASGFVTLDSLLNHATAVPVMAAPGPGADGAN